MLRDLARRRPPRRRGRRVRRHRRHHHARGRARGDRRRDRRRVRPDRPRAHPRAPGRAPTSCRARCTPTRCATRAGSSCPRASTRRSPGSCSTGSAASPRSAIVSATRAGCRGRRDGPPARRRRVALDGARRRGRCAAAAADAGRSRDPSAFLVARRRAAGRSTAFFVAIEFALVASRPTRSSRSWPTEGDARGRARACSRPRDLPLQLAGAQLGITMASLGLGVVAEPAVVQAARARSCRRSAFPTACRRPSASSSGSASSCSCTW